MTAGAKIATCVVATILATIVAALIAPYPSLTFLIGMAIGTGGFFVCTEWVGRRP